jgi:hypothetical protein
MKTSRNMTLVVLTTVLALPLWAAQPAISNRPAGEFEWGYRPAVGSEVRLNPPSLTWVHDKAAQTYEVQWSRQQDFSEASVAAQVPWPTYTHRESMASGKWFWRYRFQDATGTVSTWSVTRNFVIPASARSFPMPDRKQQVERVPQQHPRLFMRPEDLPKLRQLAKGRESAAFQSLRQQADRIIIAGPTPEPEHMGSAVNKDNDELVKYWWPNRTQTEKACLEAETLAFVYLISQEKAYGEAARRWVLHLASWNPDGPTNFRTNCEAGKPMLYRPARAYDWAWDMFTPEERIKVQSITRRRIDDAWRSGEVGQGVGHLSNPYNSHGNRVWHKIGEAGIAFLGEVPEAATWLDYAVNKFYACYPVWSDDDGGWHEGVSYWAGYMGKAVWWLQVAQSALGIDGLKKPFFAQVGDYPLYIAPPGSPNAGFGDLSFRPPSAGVGGFMEYHLRAKGAQPDGARAGYWRWWTEQWKMRGETGILGFLYAANLPDLPPAKAPADLPPSKVFHGIGVASLHTTLLSAADDVHFLIKSSPFGSQSHGHNPQNTFQLNAYGEALLPACGYRDLHGSKFHYQWVHSTIAQNGVLVNGEGQVKHVAAPQGRIAAEQFTAEYDYVLGDATPAYGGRVTRALRHVAFVKGPQPFIVLGDDLVARDPATFQFMLHALKEFEVNAAASELHVEQPKAGVAVKYLSRQPLSFRQWDGFEPPPKATANFPNQWHLQASTVEKQPQVRMLTVLVPYRHGQAPPWKAERLDQADGFGVRVEINGRTHRVVFPTDPKQGAVRVAGQ